MSKSPYNVVFFLQLVSDYMAGKADIVNLLDKVDFYIMPMFNPDGYVYTYQVRIIGVYIPDPAPKLNITRNYIRRNWLNTNIVYCGKGNYH